MTPKNKGLFLHIPHSLTLKAGGLLANDKSLLDLLRSLPLLKSTPNHVTIYVWCLKKMLLVKPVLYTIEDF